MRRTKIICTIGPASEKVETLREMIKAGMNYARLNLSHAELSYHAKLIKNIRKAARLEGKIVGILADLQGPKIRLGNLPKEGIVLKDKSMVIVTTGRPKVGELPTTYKRLHKDVKVGHKILIDDGLVELVVTKIKGQRVYATVKFGGKVTSHKGINLPDSKVIASSLTPKDRKDARFAIKEKVEWLALSFVRTAADCLELRKLVGKHPQKIIVKIEKGEAVKNIDEILNVADAIMVARGDLGVEIAAERVPIVQKDIVRKCLFAGKPVVVATQMLDSMTRNPRPTRAEVSDVANAVIDHADAVMLSGETAGGAFPVRVVETMSKIAVQTEKSHYDDLDISYFGHRGRTILAEAEGVTHLANEAKAKYIYVHGENALEFARVISHFRPEQTILVHIKDEFRARQLNLNWGVYPMTEDVRRLKLIQSSQKMLYVDANALPRQTKVEIKTWIHMRRHS